MRKTLQPFSLQGYYMVLVGQAVQEKFGSQVVRWNVHMLDLAWYCCMVHAYYALIFFFFWWQLLEM